MFKRKENKRTEYSRCVSGNIVNVNVNVSVTAKADAIVNVIVNV